MIRTGDQRENSRWGSGPIELLEFAAELTERGRFFDLRMALICIDNAIEVALKSFLKMPRSLRGSPGPTNKKYEQESRYFPNLLELAKAHAGDRLIGIPVADILYFHDMRNTLYHGIHRFDPKLADVQTYMAIAKRLCENLLGSRTSPAVDRSLWTFRTMFLLVWDGLLDRVFGLSYRLKPRRRGEGRSLQSALRILEEGGVLSPDSKKRLLRIASARDATIQGTGGLSEDELVGVVGDLSSLIGELKSSESRVTEAHTEPKPRLSPMAIELLGSSLPSGELRVLQVDQLPSPWVRAGKVDYLREDDSSFAARYFDALRELLQEGYARQVSRQLYVLTGSGFELARDAADR